MLRREDVRLVTLTGAGGVGKTRFALEVAAELLDHFTDGAFFVPLAPVSDSAPVLPTIAHVFGLQESGGRPIRDMLQGYLRAKHLLLVLDNFEQILPAAPLVAELLAACPRLAVLVTSRAPLHLRGEQTCPVSPLAYPGLDDPSPVDALAEFPAVALFVQRAAAARGGFSLTDENAAAVAEICRRLDGIPLAIELAAARSKALSPAELLARLERRLPLLTRGARDLPARQQTLRDTITWSYDLLDEPERQLFARLSVFVGGCTLEAAELVCDADKNQDFSVLDGLTALVTQSLVQRHDAEEGGSRFSMLETIREYAQEKLEASGEASRIRRHHFHYFLSFAEAAHAKIRGSHQAAWLKRLEADHANFRAALQWASSDDVDLGLRLGVAFWRFWWVRGPASEGRYWLESMLPGIDADADVHGVRQRRVSPVLARARQGAGLLSRSLGDYDRATALLEQSLDLSRRLQDQWSIAQNLQWLGSVAWKQGHHGQAMELLTGSLSRQQAVGDRPGIAWTLHVIGRVLFDQGQLDRASRLHLESLKLQRDTGEITGISAALRGLGRVAHARRDPWSAARLFGAAEALEVPRPPISFLTAACEYADHLALRNDLDDGALEAAWADGQAEPEHVIADVLRLESSLPRDLDEV